MQQAKASPFPSEAESAWLKVIGLLTLTLAARATLIAVAGCSDTCVTSFVLWKRKPSETWIEINWLFHGGGGFKEPGIRVGVMDSGCIPFQLVARKFWVPSLNFQLERPLKSEFHLVDSEESTQPCTQNPRWLLPVSTEVKAVILFCLLALMSSLWLLNWSYTQYCLTYLWKCCYEISCAKPELILLTVTNN